MLAHIKTPCTYRARSVNEKLKSMKTQVECEAGGLDRMVGRMIKWSKIMGDIPDGIVADRGTLRWAISKSFQMKRMRHPSLLASQSDAHTIAPHRDPIPYPSHTHPLIALKQERPMM